MSATDKSAPGHKKKKKRCQCGFRLSKKWDLKFDSKDGYYWD